MREFALLTVLTILPLSGPAQEPFTYTPEDIPKHEIPEGMTAEEYIQQVYEERHYKIKVTFRVIGEDAKPVPDADINVGIDSLLHADGHNNYKGRTDSKGLFTVESQGRGCTDVVIEKDGYYRSRPEVKWDGDLNPGGRVMHESGGFRPWNPTIDVVLKKTGQPVPMIVRRGNRCRSWVKPDENQLDRDLGWDLVEGEWVGPEGKGKVADLIFEFESHYDNETARSASVLIKFGNPDDGLIVLEELKGAESLLKFPRTAPEDGYDVRELEYSVNYRDVTVKNVPEKKPQGYLFRLRTVKGEDDEVTSALYGKITKPFKLRAPSAENQLPVMNFDYYLNPAPNDRNLEYDQKNNLAPEADKDLRWPP